MKLKLIVSDIDGTLLSYDNDYNFNYDQNLFIKINELKQKNIFFALSSGRHYKDIIFLIKKFKLDLLQPTFVIGMNGAQIYNLEKNELVYDDILEDQYYQEIVKFYDDFLASKEWNAIGVLACENDFFKIIKKPIKLLDRIINRFEKIQLQDNIINYEVVDDFEPREKIYKLAIIFKDFLSHNQSELKKLQALAPHLEFMVTGQHSIEIVSRKSNKGTAVGFLKNYYGIDYSQILTIGDAENDISMFNVTKHSATRKCATPVVKKYATTSFEGGPSNFVIKVLKHFID